MADVVNISNISNRAHLPKARDANPLDLQTQVVEEDGKGSDRERRELSKLVGYAIECARDNNFGEARKVLMEARESLQNTPSAADTRGVHFSSRFAQRCNSSLKRT